MSDYHDPDYVLGAVLAQVEDLDRAGQRQVLVNALQTWAAGCESAWPDQDSAWVVSITEVPDWMVRYYRAQWQETVDFDHEGVVQGWIDNGSENTYDMAREDGYHDPETGEPQ